MSVQPAGRTVLIVDDEEVVREAGYRVVQAVHGMDAVSLLERDAEGVDLVVCDLVMPVMNGRDLARWIHARRPEIPVLFISGYPVAYLEAHHLHDPGIPLLRKPFLPSRLLETVEDTLAMVGGGGGR